MSLNVTFELVFIYLFFIFSWQCFSILDIKKKSISDQSGTKLALFDDTDTYIVYI